MFPPLDSAGSGDRASAVTHAIPVEATAKPPDWLHRSGRAQVLQDSLYRTAEPVRGMVCEMHLSDQPKGMPPSHEQKRISELCSRVITTKDPAEFAQVVAELRVALRAQLAHLKELVYDAKQTIAQLPPAPLLERRKVERRRMERRH